MLHLIFLLSEFYLTVYITLVLDTDCQQCHFKQKSLNIVFLEFRVLFSIQEFPTLIFFS